MPIDKSTISFLRALKKNNNRDWFQENKKKYQAAHENMVQFTDEVLKAYGKVEDLQPQEPKKALFRIYRDVRFSKNKDPYKTNFAMHIRTQPKRLGLYVHVEPGGNSIVATGIWQPSSAQLKAVRQEIDYNAGALRKILKRKKFVDTFGELQGDELKTAPKGYDVENPNIDLLRKKQWMAWASFKDADVTSPDFVKTVVNTAKTARDFQAFFNAPLSEVE
jgi:uncharacterized protein (TIGR02453 family)